MLFVLDRTYHRVIQYKVMEEYPNIGKVIECTDSVNFICIFSEFFSSHKISLPIRNLTMLSGGRFAGIVATTSKQGEIMNSF